MRKHVFQIILTEGEDGWVLAECPDFAGCLSQGRTRRDALVNIANAIELCIEPFDQLETRRQEIVERILLEVEDEVGREEANRALGDGEFARSLVNRTIAEFREYLAPKRRPA